MSGDLHRCDLGDARCNERRHQSHRLPDRENSLEPRYWGRRIGRCVDYGFRRYVHRRLQWQRSCAPYQRWQNALARRQRRPDREFSHHLRTRSPAIRSKPAAAVCCLPGVCQRVIKKRSWLLCVVPKAKASPFGTLARWHSEEADLRGEQALPFDELALAESGSGKKV